MMEFMAFCIQFPHVRRIKVDVECQSVVWEQQYRKRDDDVSERHRNQAALAQITVAQTSLG
jgi:hypothetical protein